MYLNIPFSARENQIPKGCRKPRLVDVTRHHAIQIQEVSAEDAPIALVETPIAVGIEAQDLDLSSSETPSSVPRIYRWYDTRLWVPMSAEQEVTFRAHLADPAGLGQKHVYFGPTSMIISKLDEWARTRLVIDGVPHIESGEPYYHMDLTNTLSFTWLGLEVGHAAPLLNNPTEDKFPVTQAEQARARVREIHEVFVNRRNPNLALPELPALFEVRLPEAIRHCFHPSARTPTRVHVEMHCTIEAQQAWAVPFSRSKHQGFRLPDGRRVIPQVGLALFDEATGQLTPLTTDAAGTLGFFVTPAEHGTYRQVPISD